MISSDLIEKYKWDQVGCHQYDQRDFAMKPINLHVSFSQLRLERQ